MKTKGRLGSNGQVIASVRLTEAIVKLKGQSRVVSKESGTFSFAGKVEEVEKLYRQYKADFKDGFLDDFAEFDRLSVIPEEREKDMERIKEILKE